MQYCSAHPSPALSHYVKNYWAMENILPPGQVYIHRIIPTGLPDLSFYLHNRPQFTASGKIFETASTVTGQQKEYFNIALSGRTSLFSVTFQPMGLAAFFDIPAHELFTYHVPLHQLIPADEVCKIEDRLFESPTFEEKTKEVEAFLTQLLQNNSGDYPAQRISASMLLINRSKGLASINTLAQEACYSRKQFERVFASKVGMSPGQFLRVVRFQHALQLGASGQSQSLTGLSYMSGYYDQAHMVNEFQKFSGLTPSQFFKDCTPYSDYFQ